MDGWVILAALTALILIFQPVQQRGWMQKAILLFLPIPSQELKLHGVLSMMTSLPVTAMIMNWQVKVEMTASKVERAMIH